MRGTFGHMPKDIHINCPTGDPHKSFRNHVVFQLSIDCQLNHRYDHYIHVSVNTFHKKRHLFINIFVLVNITSHNRDDYNDSRPSCRRRQIFNNKNKYIKHKQNFDTFNISNNTKFKYMKQKHIFNKATSPNS